MLPLSYIPSFLVGATFDPSNYVDRAWNAGGLSTGERVELLVNELTLAEKLTMVRGVLGEYTGNVPSNERVGIPSLNMQDGPQGFRDDFDRDSVGKSTAWPSALTVAATFDADLMYDWALAMGKEFRLKGANVALAPGVNLARVPRAGRNFEYLAGEDPFLGYTLVQPYIRGIQDNGVIANVKHFAINNQEAERLRVSANVNKRTMMEIDQEYVFNMLPLSNEMKAKLILDLKAVQEVVVVSVAPPAPTRSSANSKMPDLVAESD